MTADHEPVVTPLSSRVRMHEAAPWVVREIQKLEARLACLETTLRGVQLCCGCGICRDAARSALGRVCAEPGYTPAIGPAPVYVALTPDQTEKLKAHFQFVTDEAARGYKGMLAAQVWGYDSGPSMRVGFVPHDVAVKIQGTAL